MDYHNNINLQMNYWPALTTGLAECAEPLTEFILSMRKPGAVTARKYFNARGWMAGISGNPFGFTAPFVSQDMSWNYNPVAAHWLATHLWEYYEFTRDKQFLAKVAYPVLKECAQFSETTCGKNRTARSRRRLRPRPNTDRWTRGRPSPTR